MGNEKRFNFNEKKGEGNPDNDRVHKDNTIINWRIEYTQSLFVETYICTHFNNAITNICYSKYRIK